MILGPNEVVIDDSTPDRYRPVIDGVKTRGGAVPRDYAVQPEEGMHAVSFTLIPRVEWPERIRDMEATKSRLSDLRLRANHGQPAPSLDQNGKGYCWAHSATNAVQLLRFVANSLYVPLSAYAVACRIKDFEDEGGWGALALDFIIKKGVPSQAVWPQQSMDRAHDNPATWEDAAKHKVTEGWIDLAASVYDRNLTFDQMATLLLSRVPVVIDLNWWGHSVCAVDLVETGKSTDLRTPSGKMMMTHDPVGFDALFSVIGFGDSLFGDRIWNSWGDGWSDRGMGILAGRKAVPDGAVSPLVTNA